MADPQTTNILLSIPVRGSDVGVWDVPVNGDFTALDGYLGGVATVAVASAPVTLTSPSGVPTPGAGPTQAQNAVLRCTGAMSSGVTITLPLPGYYIVENLTTAAFVLSFRAIGAGQVIAVDQGETQHVYNDGTNVKFVNFGRVGHIEMWAGLSVMPAWVAACTVPPFLLCDGSVYNFATYPYLGARLLGNFGGNGITTFGVPDLRGRAQLPYDGTGTRITAAGCGINGQTLGASQDKQTNTLLTGNLPPYTPSGSSAFSGGNVSIPQQGFAGSGSPQTSAFSQGSNNGGGTVLNVPVTGSVSFTGAPQGGISTAVNNVQPAQVTGIAVIKAA